MPRSPTAARDIVFGEQLSQEDIVPVPGSDHLHQLDGKVALIDIPQGEEISTTMVADSIAAGLTPPGRVLAVVRLANPEILHFATSGAAIDIYAPTDTGVDLIANDARVIHIPRAESSKESDTPWELGSENAKTSIDSSTVLVAVRPKESDAIARIPAWDSSLVAALTT